jgi:phage gp36-like protein
MFLEKSELKTVSTDEIIDRIINNDSTIVNDIIEESIDVVKGYLFEYFDTTAIFLATGNNRSKTVLKHLKSIVRYELYARRSKVMNEVAKLSYDEAILWLEKVASGKIKPDLPIKVNDTNGDGTPDTPATFMKLGSRKKYQNNW